MPDVVSSAELAVEVDTSPQRLARWLRAQRASGHPLLAAIPARSPFRFTREHEDQLAAEFEAAT
ncbi:MAG: hypothetical protein AVDCRST_MAG53-1642, partial [uncultured Solirubrobacteraceae bacterium]